MKTRDLLHRNFFQSRDPSDWSKYKESRDTIKEILRETERNYTFLEVQQNKSNPSSLWKVINRVIPSKNKEPQRVYTKDLKTVADEFGQRLVSGPLPLEGRGSGTIYLLN